MRMISPPERRFLVALGLGRVRFLNVICAVVDWGK